MTPDSPTDVPRPAQLTPAQGGEAPMRPGSGPLRGLETAHFDFRGGTPREPHWLPGERRPLAG